MRDVDGAALDLGQPTVILVNAGDPNQPKYSWWFRSDFWPASCICHFKAELPDLATEPIKTVQSRRTRNFEKTTMGKSIPLELNPSTTVEVDAELVAPGLGLDVADFRQLMSDGKVSVLCERGIGEDSGMYRATFYHDGNRVRLVVDAEGNRVG